MNKNTSAWIIVGLVLAVIGIWLLIGMSYQNQEVSLRVQAQAQQKVNETMFDTAWKTISQQAQIADKYQDQFKSVYGQIMAARYNGQDHLLAKFITEHNPQFDSSLLGKMMNTVEEQRAAFQESQQQLIDIKQEHDKLLVKMPSKWFLGGIQPLDITVVTSTRTDNTFVTGKDDDVSVFNGNK
jgi:hypothetical protein